MSKIFTALLILVLSVSVWGCKDDATSVSISPQIEGTVLDDETNQPIAGATITTTPASVSIITDANGNFLIKDLQAIEYSVNASASGYFDKSVVVATHEGAKTTAVIKLRSYQSANRPPNMPVLNSNGVINADSTVTGSLTWSATDPDANALVFDVYWGETSGELTKILTATQLTSHIVRELKLDKSYFWKVVAIDPYGASTESDITLFKMTAAPVINDVVLMLKFDGNTTDSGPNKLNGTGQNVTYTTGHDGKANGAVLFNTENAIVNVPYNSKLNLNNSFTISFWIKPLDGYGIVVPGCNTIDVIGRWYGEQKSISEFVCAISSTGSFGFYTGVGNDLDYSFPGIYIPTTSWKNITVVYTNGTAKFYENGEYINRASMYAPNVSTLPLRIGGNRAPNNNSNFSCFYGAIDNLYIYNKALTDSEIIQIVQE